MMTDQDTLLAYLVPKVTTQVEVAATKSLAFILNKSEAGRAALDALIQADDFRLPPMARLTAEETVSKGARLDLVGYDARGRRRVLVEAKFWAPLDPGQIRGYFRLLNRDRPGVLLFLVPDRRVSTVWAEVLSVMAAAGKQLTTVVNEEQRKAAAVSGTDRRIMLMTWNALLKRMEQQTSEPGVQSDIQQLRGLTQAQEGSGFAPLTSDASADDFAERDVHFRRMIDDAVAIGRRQGWINTDGLQWGVGHAYRRRYLHLVGTNAGWIGLGVEYRQNLYEQTPLWIWSNKDDWQGVQRPAGTVERDDDSSCYTPVELPPKAEYEALVKRIVTQLRQLQDALPPSRSDGNDPA